MKALLLSLALVSLAIVAAPVASAEPCEVPGCNVVGAALCLAADAKNPKTMVSHLDECLTQPA